MTEAGRRTAMTRSALQFAMILAILFGTVLAAAQPACAAPKPGAQVDLDDSFQIPKAKGKDSKGHHLSHTPALVLTADGKRMVTATADKEIIVFDAKTRKLLKRHRLSEKATDAVSVDANGRLAAWVLKGGGIVVVNVETGKTIARDDKAGAKWIALSADGKRLAISRGKVVETRLVKGQKLSVERTHDARKGQITNLAWSHDGALLASTAGDGTFHVVRAASGKPVFQAKKGGALYALDFHPTKQLAVFGGHDKKVYQVDLKTKKEKVISGSQPYWITCLGYSPNGKMVAVGDESCDVWLYDLKKPGKSVFHSKHHVECWLTQVAWSSDNETFLFGCRPNSHTGKPALYTALNYTEAARSPAARKSRKVLLASVEAGLKSSKDKKVRTALEALRKSLNNEEKLHGQGGFGGGLQVNYALTAVNRIAVSSQGKLPSAGTGLSPASTKILPASVQKLLKTHQETQQKARSKLQATFNINQWRVKGQ